MKSVAIVFLTCLLCLMSDVSLGSESLIESNNDVDHVSIDVGSPEDSITVCETENVLLFPGEEIRFKSGNFTRTGELAPCWLFVFVPQFDLIRLSFFYFHSLDVFTVDMYDSLVETSDRNLLIGTLSGAFHTNSTIPLMQASWNNYVAIRFSRFPSLLGLGGLFSGKLTVVPHEALSTSVTACQTTRLIALPGKEIRFQLDDNFNQDLFNRTCWLFVTTSPEHVIKLNVTFSVPKINHNSTTILRLFDSLTATENTTKLFTSLFSGFESPQTSPRNHLAIKVTQLYLTNGYGFNGTITSVPRSR